MYSAKSLPCSLANPLDGVTQDFYWRDYIRGDIPYDAIEGAPGRYIGQVNYNGNHVATIFSHNKIAAIEWVVRINFTTDIKVS